MQAKASEATRLEWAAGVNAETSSVITDDGRRIVLTPTQIKLLAIPVLTDETRAGDR